MSPDARVFVAAVDRGLRRARLVAVLEAIAWGAAAAAITPIAGIITALGVALLRLRRISRTTIVGRFERVVPAARNLFITAEEMLEGRLSAADRVRERVFADASERTRSLDVRRAAGAVPVWAAAIVAGLAWTIVFMARGEGARVIRTLVATNNATPVAGRRPALTVRVTLHAPSYTGVPDTYSVDPAELRAIEGSVAVLSIEAAAGRVNVEHDGAARTLERTGSGLFSDRLALARTGYVVVSTDAGARLAMPVVVSPDALPTVRITAPGRDLVYSSGNASIGFTARATDDYGLRSLSLRYTKVSGSGEEYQFTEGEIPLTVSRTNARDWSGAATRTLADLGLHEGDMLVYRAMAADARPGDGSASSDAFFIEMSRLGVAAGDAFTLPEQETRYALSQQMLIVKTERLTKQRAAMDAQTFGEASQNLAVEQRMIRAEFVFMLGGEIEDEEVEAERSVELQAGRLANRGQSDLRAATIAMSQAEKLLTASNPSDALTAERSAVVALQRAFARDRYILRASPTRVDLDPKRRLTGDLSTASGWTRALPETPANRRSAQLMDLLKGLGDLGAAPDRARAAILAEQALRIDAQSANLRDAATALQRLDVQAAVRAVTAETARTLLGGPAEPVDFAPGLRRALVEHGK